ncbi:hypothetical protein [Actinokineospora sp. NPDC004072]
MSGVGQSPPAAVPPMLAAPGQAPAGPGWAFEFKWDDMRAQVAVGAGAVQVTTRSMREVTSSFPEPQGLIPAFREPVLLDG